MLGLFAMLGLFEIVALLGLMGLFAGAAIIKGERRREARAKRRGDIVRLGLLELGLYLGEVVGFCIFLVWGTW